MSDESSPIETLSEIRDLMARSSRFLSLSGLSGVSAGIFALVGAAIAWYILHGAPLYITRENIFMLMLDAIGVLILSLTFGFYFTWRSSRRKGLPIWDSISRRMLANLFIPLITGGLFCLILIYRHAAELVAPATLIFYGLALLNASKYTVEDIRYLGILEIALGLMSCLMTNYNLIFWATGFGLLHIVYGTFIYYKYE